MKNKKTTKSLYEESGGIRFGDSYWFASNYTWPFAKIVVFKDKLVIVFNAGAWNPKKIEFKKKEIKYVELRRGIFSKGVRIHHNKSRTFPFILFWSFDVNNLMSHIKNAGYEIK